MIDQDIMDQIIEVPDEEEKTEQLIDQLIEEGFVVTNFSKGGVFYTLLRIIVHIGVELKKLAVELINSAFMNHCPDDWVEIRAADYSKALKDGSKTEGYVTVYRSNPDNGVTIAKGHPFRTNTDSYGNYLRYYAKEKTFIEPGCEMAKILVQAENIGAAYNVNPGTIVHTMVHIDGYDHVTNETGWMVQEGTDTESIESLRRRCLNSRYENAVRTIDMKVKSVAEEVKGVAFVKINSQHPRGQGTVDVIVTGTSGTASEKTLSDVSEAISPLTGPYGDYLVKSAEIQNVDIDMELYIRKNINTEGFAEKAEEIIRALMSISGREDTNVLYLSQIYGAITNRLDNLKDCIINSPESNVVADESIILMPGTITINVHSE